MTREWRRLGAPRLDPVLLQPCRKLGVHIISHKNAAPAASWDNRCTMHRGTEYDERRWKRDMHRATVSDIGNTCEA